MTDRYKEAIQGARDCVERNKDGGVYLPDLLVVIDSQQAEIEKLTINMNAFGLGMKREKERADQIKAEAIKEFAERLKNFGYKICKPNGDWVTVVKEINIDNLLKEMEGDDK